uniref:Skp1-related protein n=1 Tax=Romanomermis culicivorax TaxID=13658 RepID=A0A915K0D2_ROMCU
MEHQQIIKLKSAEGEIFPVDVKMARLSHTLATMLDDLCHQSSGSEEEIIILPNISTPILKKVVEWFEHYKNNPPVVPEYDEEERRSDDVPAWDAQFLVVDHDTLFGIIKASNYLDIKGLLTSSCKTLANMIKGRPAEEVRATFNLKNDFTPEEEEAIKKENAWCED